MIASIREKYFHEAFEISVLIKFFSGFWEIAAGCLIWSRAWPPLSDFFVDLAQGSPLFVRNDVVMRSVIHFFGDTSASTRRFLIIYLLLYGVIKIAMSAGLLRGYKWSYPVGMSVIGIFVAYQIYRVVHTHSAFLALMICIDLITIGLIVHEYLYKYWQKRKVAVLH